MPPSLAVVTWTQQAPSGGNTYNRELTAALGELGAEVRTVRVPGTWPDPTPADLVALERALAGLEVAVVDGIVGGAAPGVVRRAAAAGTRVHILVHMPLAAEPGLSAEVRRRREDVETRALREAAGILCPSSTAADALRARGFAVTVATPGVRPAAPAPGSAAGGTPRLLCLGAVSRTKDQLTLVRALHEVRHLRWDSELVGPGEPGYVPAVRAEIERTDLAGRTTLTGPRTGAALERTWAAADLLLLPSRTETYGLVVTEALARGVPAVVGLGTGAVEALRAGLPQDGPLPGCAAPPGDAPAWAGVLRAWLTDAAVRDRWRQAAMSSRDHLPRWQATARTVLASL